MVRPTSLVKRLVVGRPVRTEHAEVNRLRKRVAFPTFAANAMSSVAYAPEQVFVVLSIAGAGAYALSGWVGLFVALVMIAVVASYRQNVRAYPGGGGDYEVATVNHGRTAGLVVGSALMVDYILTVAVSISAAALIIGSVAPIVSRHKVWFCLVAIVLLVALKVRGVKETRIAFTTITYAFIIGIYAMIAVGLFRVVQLDEQIRAESADLQLVSEPDMAGVGIVFLALRAFASGCVALTGFEAISGGVRDLKPPRAKNAAATLLVTGFLAVGMFIGLIALANITGAKVVESPLHVITGTGTIEQKALLVQLANAVFGDFTAGVIYVVATTGLILLFAASTAFSGFPILGSILASDRYLPRQLYTRGDRLAYSNGILILAAAAIVLVAVFQADVSRLIQLYIVGAFVSFVLSQSGMVRHWKRLLTTERDRATRARMRRSQAVNIIGLVMTATALTIVVTTRFTHGSWISLAFIALIFFAMRGIRRHYDRVLKELEPPKGRLALPPRNHVIVLVSTVHKPAIRALAYAKATRPDSITALTVNVDTNSTRNLQTEWERRKISVPLTIVDSPYREITNPIVDYVTSMKRNSPRELVTVFIPEYVAGRWWEKLLHNQSALRIKSRLRYERGVIVATVPWQLESSSNLDLERLDDRLAGRA